jgi:hypothetical protein
MTEVLLDRLRSPDLALVTELVRQDQGSGEQNSRR